jgi:hypothetical protein
MRFGDRQRAAIARVHFAQACLEASDMAAANTHRLDVHVDVAPVAALQLGWISVDAVVEKAFAGEVRVQADHIGRAWRLREPHQFRLARTVIKEVLPERMAGRHATGEQVEAEPAPLVLELGLVAQAPRAADMADVVGLHQPRARVHRPDRPHRQPHALHLVQQRAHERPVTPPVRIPQAVQTH